MRLALVIADVLLLAVLVLGPAMLPLLVATPRLRPRPRCPRGRHRAIMLAPVRAA